MDNDVQGERKAGMRLSSCVFIAVVFSLSSGVSHAREAWRLLPCFGKHVRGIERHAAADGHFYSEVPEQARPLLSEDGGLDERQRELVGWHAVEFPHREFMELMPARRSFGWYGCEFDVPPELCGMDVIVDLGIIDDSDETFVNGTKVGCMGRVPDGSAWHSDRLYRVQGHLLNRYFNYMVVHVWSLWGLGGIVGPAVLKAALAPQDAQWEVAFVPDGGGVGGGLNAADTTEKALDSLVCGGPLEWTRGTIPWKGYASWKEGCSHAVFRMTFDLKDHEGTPRTFTSPVVVDMGPVFDVAAFYLNGRRAGRLGRFPEDGVEAFTEAAERGTWRWSSSTR